MTPSDLGGWENGPALKFVRFCVRSCYSTPSHDPMTLHCFFSVPMLKKNRLPGCFHGNWYYGTSNLVYNNTSSPCAKVIETSIWPSNVTKKARRPCPQRPRLIPSGVEQCWLTRDKFVGGADLVRTNNAGAGGNKQRVITSTPQASRRGNGLGAGAPRVGRAMAERERGGCATRCAAFF